MQTNMPQTPDESLVSKPGAAAPAVTVQVLHWRGLSKTMECLESLRKLTYSNYRVLVVANGAEAGDAQAISDKYPEVELLSLSDNFGFAGGSNRGIEHALKSGADYIWLLNNDALSKPDTLSKLVDALEKCQNGGAAAALVLEGKVAGAGEAGGAGRAESSPGAEDKVDLRQVAGIGKIDFLKAKTYLRPLPQTANNEHPEGQDCLWLSGSNLLLKSSAIKQVGSFDEKYFLYFEDVDLCYRLKQAGYALILVPSTVVEHEGNASTQGGLSLWRNYYHTRNRLYFFRKHTPALLLPVAYLSILSHFLKHCLTLPLRGKKGRAKLYAEWLGVRDYFCGRSGRATCLDWCNSLEL